VLFVMVIVIVLRVDLPGVVAGCDERGFCISGRCEFSDDRVDRPAAIGHYEHEFNDSAGQTGPRRNRRVQIDLHPARAIGTQAVCASLAGCKLEAGLSIPLPGIKHTAGQHKNPAV